MTDTLDKLREVRAAIDASTAFIGYQAHVPDIEEGLYKAIVTLDSLIAQQQNIHDICKTPSALNISEQESIVEVCPECDIAGCVHLRAQQKTHERVHSDQESESAGEKHTNVVIKQDSYTPREKQIHMSAYEQGVRDVFERFPSFSFLDDAATVEAVAKSIGESHYERTWDGLVAYSKERCLTYSQAAIATIKRLSEEQANV